MASVASPGRERPTRRCTRGNAPHMSASGKVTAEIDGTNFLGRQQPFRPTTGSWTEGDFATGIVIQGRRLRRFSLQADQRAIYQKPRAGTGGHLSTWRYFLQPSSEGRSVTRRRASANRLWMSTA
jgi:hypothetical protein